jgi:molybdenum cofactor synthesis domain-containing protein
MSKTEAAPVSSARDAPQPILVADSAAALVIGNELLSGKVQEQNLLELARLLRAIGVRLVKASVVLDDTQALVREIRELAASVDVVFTSGGVGPTHDDVTVEAVALAFGVRVVSDPVLEKLLRATYAERLNEAHLRMALVPEGARLVSTEDVKWPTILMRNVFLLPGVPEIFRMKLDAVRKNLRGRQPFFSKAAYVLLEEAELKGALDAVVAAHPDVDVGSYPKWFEPAYRTKITFDSRGEEAAQRALADFIERLLPAQIVRVE